MEIRFDDGLIIFRTQRRQDVNKSCWPHHKRGNINLFAFQESRACVFSVERVEHKHFRLDE